MNDKPLSAEIRLVKSMDREGIRTHLLASWERHKYSNTKYLIFRTFGWFDYLIIVLEPKVRCKPFEELDELDNYNKNYKLRTMTSSFMCWLEKEKNECKNNELYNIFLDIHKHKNYENIKNINNRNNMIEVFLLSFIKLGRKYKSNKNFNEISKEFIKDLFNLNESSEIKYNFIIFNYLGNWDYIVFLHIPTDDNSNFGKKLKEYKEKILLSEKILQSSTILATTYFSKLDIDKNDKKCPPIFTLCSSDGKLELYKIFY